LNLASRYAHHIIAIRDQGVYAQGNPETIVNEKLVRDVFDIQCQITVDPMFGTPMCIPYGKGRKLTPVKLAATSG
jgi:iron complex transport system ATP-binding protein